MNKRIGLSFGALFLAVRLAVPSVPSLDFLAPQSQPQASIPKATPLKVVMISPEADPFSKAGGLGDYVFGLSEALQKNGDEVTVISPLYGTKKKELIQKYKMQVMDPLRFRVGNETVQVQIYTCKLNGVTHYFLANDQYCDKLYVGRNKAEWFKKAVVLSRGALELMKKLSLSPDILHTNDWMTALVPMLLKADPAYAKDSLFRQSKTVHTIHNVGRAYQGAFSRFSDGEDLFKLLNVDWMHLFGLTYFTPQFWGENNDRINDPSLLDLWKQDKFGELIRQHPEWFELNLTAGAIGQHADQVATVSYTFRTESLSHDMANGLELLLQARGSEEYRGIVNGTDSSRFVKLMESMGGKEAAKQKLVEKMGLDPKLGDGPILGMVTRVTEQKGLDLVAGRAAWKNGDAYPSIVEEGKIRSLLESNKDLSFVFLGTAAQEDLKGKLWEKELLKLNDEFPGRVAVRIAYDQQLADEIYIGSDLFLMPSQYEPCGIAQLNAMAVGTLPIVRTTGGLADTVVDYLEDSGEGFHFKNFHARAMEYAVKRALFVYREAHEKWPRMIEKARAAGERYTWENTALEYQKLYREMRIPPSAFNIKRSGELEVIFPMPENPYPQRIRHMVPRELDLSDFIRVHEKDEHRRYVDETGWATSFHIPKDTVEILSSDARFVFVSVPQLNGAAKILWSDINNRPGILLGVSGVLPGENRLFIASVWAKKEDFSRTLKELFHLIENKGGQIQTLHFEMGGHFTAVRVESGRVEEARRKIGEKWGSPFLQDHMYGCAIDQWGYLFSTEHGPGTFAFRKIETFLVPTLFDIAI